MRAGRRRPRVRYPWGCTVNEYQRARRFEDRTRWAPLCLISEEGKPYAYKVIREDFQAAVSIATEALDRMTQPRPFTK